MRANATTLIGRPLAAGCAALLLLACGPVIATPTATVSHGHAPPPAPASVAPTIPIATATGAGVTAAIGSATPVAFTGDRLFVHDSAGQGRYLVLDSATGRVERTLPVGTPNADWTILYTVTGVGGQTRVEAIEAATGQPLRSTTLDGDFGLPGYGAGQVLGGLAGGGQVLILAARPTAEEVATFEREQRWVSRFAALDTSFKTPPRTIELEGNYSFDTLAPSGNLLYLIEHRPPVRPTEEYAVRVYDVAAGALRPGAVVDKASARQVMEGTPGEQVVSRNGEWVYTVYRNAEYGPFVHALNVINQFAMCIDLPQAGKEDSAASGHWGLVLSADGATIYAANGALGHVVEISASDQSIRRTAAFTPHADAPVGPLARLGARIAPAAAARAITLQNAALAADGRTLYVLGERGILSLDTATLAVRQRLAPEETFSSIAASSDGSEIYLVNAGGRAQRRGAATGEVRGEYGEGTLLGILRVEAKR